MRPDGTCDDYDEEEGGNDTGDAVEDDHGHSSGWRGSSRSWSAAPTGGIGLCCIDADSVPPANDDVAGGGLHGGYVIAQGQGVRTADGSVYMGVTPSIVGRFVTAAGSDGAEEDDSGRRIAHGVGEGIEGVEVAHIGSGVAANESYKVRIEEGGVGVDPVDCAIQDLVLHRGLRRAQP